MEHVDLKRRLAAILCVDMVGYTRLMSVAEEATHAAYTEHLAEVFEPKVTRYRGRIVKSTGDGFIAEFESVVNAVECATETQSEIGRRTSDVPADRRIAYRIGINLGDIIVEQNDIYGDGVNIAARLQEMAPAGGICVSQTVFEQVRAKLPTRFDDLGRRRVKNIADPIRVYRVVGAVAGEGRLAHLRRAVSDWRVLAGLGTAAVVLAAIAVALDIGGLSPWFTAERPLAARLAVPTDKPSIAVLAFENMSNDQKQQYFAEGIAEDITTDLSKLAGLFVISRSSSFSYKDTGKDSQTIARELGVRYLLQGSVRRSGEMVRINTQLIDGNTGMHVWAARHDSNINEIFDVQDKISGEIVSALSVRLRTGEGKPQRLLGTKSVAAYDAYLQGWAFYRRLDSTNHGRAVALFERAIALDPGYAQAHAALAATYLAVRNNGWTVGRKSDDPMTIMVNAQKHARELMMKAQGHIAKALRNPTPLSHRVKSQILSQQRKHDEAIQEAAKAITLDPNDADSYAQLGLALVWAGRASDALEPLNKAIRLNPNYPDLYLAYLGIAHFVLQDHSKAMGLLEQSIERNPGNELTLVHLIAAYGHLGRQKEAKTVIGRIDQSRAERGLPQYVVKTARRLLPYRHGQDALHLLVGLHKAGVANDHTTDRGGPVGRRPMTGSKPNGDRNGATERRAN